MSRARDIADLSSVSARLDTVGGSSGALSNRNIIINGAMQVAQRGSVAAIQTAYGACDRFKLQSTSAARFDTSQSTDVPSGQGFANSLKLDCSTADTSLASGDYYFIMHQIEGLNLQHLKYGTSDAVQCTLSFWVKSPKTGIHNVEIEHVDGGKFNTHQYTIASANTWQKVSFTFDGNTAASIANDATVGMLVTWWLQAGSAFTSGTHTSGWSTGNSNRAVGQVNVSDSTSNDFYLTGVQLEVGAQETDFEHRTFADDLRQCQRYLERRGTDTGGWEFIADAGQLTSATNYQIAVRFNEQMRTTPTLSRTGNLSDVYLVRASNIFAVSSVGLADNTNGRTVLLTGTVANTGGSAGEQTRMQTLTAGNQFFFDAEL